ncbi:MutS-related protein [Flavobacterium psychrophilum]|uniref:MutS-related protein n=1 Tax=Flavobacterium psychrophilum TaxID=96345 RepID=UPI001069F415|nr:DNA mismatch repair protein MutS [Flavobacterium psychrophilum]
MQYIIALILMIIVYITLIRKKKSEKINSNNWFNEKDTNFDFYLISKYLNNRINIEKKYYQFITDKVSIDIDLDDVFKKTDRTISKIGQQYLYYKIRVIKNDFKQLEVFQNLIDYFKINQKQRNECIKELSNLNTSNGYYFEELLNKDVITNKRLVKICLTINIVFIILIIITFFKHIFFLTLIPVFCTNLFFHYRNKGAINYHLDNISEFSKTLNTAKNILKIDPAIKTFFENIDFFEPLLKYEKTIKAIIIEKYFKNEYLLPFWLILELLKVSFNIEVILFNSLLQNINKHKEQMNDLYKFIGEIDSSISFVGFNLSGNHFCKPTFVNTKEIFVENLYHPIIPNCITNTLELKNKSMLLTGSNMSGKTTFVRALAINSIYSQTVNISFADCYKAPFFKIFSSIRTQDNINSNKSFYLDEVLTIKDFITSNNINEPHLFILDEIFKGTNTLERIAIGKAVLSFLNKQNNFVFVSTHDLELADLLVNDNFNLFHFSEDISDESLTFSHKLQKGKLQTRNAIRILGLYDYPNEIIDEANKIYTKSLEKVINQKE